MKKTRLSRRLLSLILALALVVSLFAGLALSAFAVPSLPAANTRVRHIDCTALSAQAIAYYGSGQYSYAQMSQLSGVNNAEDCWATTQNNPLYTRLQTLMSSTQTYNTTYTGTSDGSLASYWVRTDAQNSSSTYYCFYSDLLYGSSGFPNDMQREHIWPKSNASYYQTNGGSDLHHLRPSVGSLNNSKSNKSFGEMTHDSSNTKYVVSGDASTVYYSGTYFEPKDDIKGDVARILLYVYCRWGQPNLYTDVASSKLPSYDSDDSQNNGTRAIDGRDILLKWVKNDPVDTWEMERNDRVQDVQGNRNVFIDYPEYAWLVFGLTPPSDMTTPSGMAAQSGVSYTVQATSNNNNYGTVSVSGTVITASPASGYYAAGYNVTSGSATVSQNGNTFTVSPSSNCTVQIVFAPLQAATVSYMAAGSSYGSAYSGYAGDTVTLPSNATAVTDWTFVGWSDSSFNDVTTQPSFYAPGAGYNAPAGTTTLYAVYTQSSGSGNGFTKYTGAIAEGDYLIVAGDSAMNNTTTSNRLQMTGVTVSNDTITTTDTAIIWHIAASGSYWTIYNNAISQYAVSTTTKNQMTTAAGTDRGLWTITNSDSGAVIENKARTEGSSDTANAYIRRNGTYGFACYTSSYGTGPVLYKKTGTTTWSVNPTNVQHTHTLAHTAAVAADCTTAGNIEFWHCSGCNKYFSDAQATNEITQAATVTAALGHNYVAGTPVAATCTTDGYTPYSCSRCGDSYNDDPVAALGHDFSVAQNTVIPTASAPGYTVYKCSRCTETENRDYTYLITFTVPQGVGTPADVYLADGAEYYFANASAPEGYTFLGWVRQSYAEDNTTAPAETIYNQSTPYWGEGENVTFKALYSRVEQGTGTGTPVTTYDLVESADDVEAGTYVITWANSQYLPSETTATKNPYVGSGITVDNDKLTNTVTDEMKWTFAGDNTNGFSITHEASGGTTYYLGAYNNAQGILVDTTGATTDRFYSWTASVDATYGMVLKCSDTGTRYLAVYTPTSGTPSWRYYGLSANNYKDTLRLYKETTTGGGTGDTTYYTTEIPYTQQCTHQSLHLVAAVEPSCTANGSIAYYHCDSGCGKNFSDIPDNGGVELSDDDITVAALGHQTGAWSIDENNHWHVCGRCGVSLDQEAHTIEETVTKPATAIETGIKTCTCSVCGYSYTEELPTTTVTTESGVYKLSTTGIRNGDKVIIYNPKNGTGMTSNITANYYLEGPALATNNGQITDPDSAYVWTVVDNGDGTFSFTQGDYTLLGYVSGSYVDLAVERTNETTVYIDKWVVDALTSTEGDSNTYSILCDGMSYTKSSTTYNSVYLEFYNARFALYGNNNDLDGIADNSAYAMQFYVLDETPIVYGSSLTLNGKINTNAYISIPDSLVEDGLYYSIDGGTPVQINLTDKQANGLYKFTEAMPARDMNTKVTLTLTDGNGAPVVLSNELGESASSYEFCVQDYLQTVINAQAGTYRDELVALCKAMSDYGSYAQVQQNYHIDTAHAIYNADAIAAVDTSVSWTPTVEELGSGIEFYGTSVVMLSETTIRYWFRITGSGSFTATVDGTDATLEHYSGRYYYVEVSNIAAKDLGSTFTVAVSDGTNSAAVSGYGVYNYVQQVVSDQNSDPALVNLCKAIRYYGEAAVAYFG